ncbi:MAG: hypothetical protein LBR57_04255 [Alistipes sp.]|jgi:hypothetical protein|nr:hypothetical protein [Alistipes sp.]
MKANETFFKGRWHAVAKERRVRGVWEPECEFAPREWWIEFNPAGAYREKIVPESKEIFGRWAYDRQGILYVHATATPESLSRYVFDGTETEGWLYAFEGIPHIPFIRRSIMAHHAHMRLKLIRDPEYK